MKTEELKHAFIEKYGYPETRLLSLETVNEELISDLDEYAEQVANEPFTGFYKRLRDFVSNVQVNDAMSEEEKDMILYVCNEFINKT